MRFATLDRNLAGVSVSVAALRTPESCGVGEFSDLVALGTWCAENRIDLIQLLPVNDTGAYSSPYSALSAFALHPLYLRLQDVPGMAKHSEEIQRFRVSAAAYEGASGGRFSYPQVLAFKQALVRRVYEENSGRIEKDAAFLRWKNENPWVVPYAVFTALKSAAGLKPWWEWQTLTDPRPGQIESWARDHSKEYMATAWMQFLLDAQLSTASRTLAARGVSLKGDIPILMTADSADVWAERRYFDLTARAGAPPDMFSPDGQNWGFPVYDWDALGHDDYRWWKARLRQAGKFFQAFRIDHVLGFFRIWRIPRGETTGLLGQFSPSVGASLDELAAAGFDEGRLRWLSLPHLSRAEVTQALGAEAEHVIKYCLRRIGSEDLYNLQPELDGEVAIKAASEPDPTKSFLLSWHANRALLLGPEGKYHPTWYMESTKGFRSLSVGEQETLRGLFARKRQESETEWEGRGERLLAIMQSSTDMLACAEDLGDVPRCVPRVLSRLGILGLKIMRWAREYETTPAGQQAPFTPPSRFPRLSVCTPSVHDTSTLRGWWEEDPVERETFFHDMGEIGPCPVRMTVGLLQKIMTYCASANSIIAVFQIQDILDLDESLWRPDPKMDRINVPGTMTESNWTWRIPVEIEKLSEKPVLSRRLAHIMEARHAPRAAQ